MRPRTGEVVIVRVPTGDSPISESALRALAANPVVMADLIQALHRRVHDSDTLLDLMGRVAREAVKLVDGVEWAGVTAQFAAGPFTTAYTDNRVLFVDERQYADQDGPCLRAMRTGTRINASRAEAEATWPHLAAIADSVDIHSFLALPVRGRPASIGSLNMYGPDDAITEPDGDLLAVLTDYLNRGFSDFSRSRHGSVAEAALRDALTNWGRVEQAVGVMMDVYGFSVDYARDVLDDRAADAGRTLAEQAEHVVGGIAPPHS